MSQSDRAIKKFATQLARLDREVKSWRGAQADFTSIENGGNFTFKDADGNVTAIMGGQDDGSNTIRHVDGPTPPIPSGLSAHVDGPIVQVSWDGSFEDADTATYDWSHLEVIVVGPGNEQLTATINDVTGATANLAATVSGEWTVGARSVSRAEKRSLDGDAGTVEVELVGLTGAINDAIGSANGKNTVTYSEVAPTLADEGIVGDTWFVGQVGRPNDIIEGTNLARNPGAHPDGTPWGWSGGSGVVAEMSSHTRGGLDVARATCLSGSSYLYLTSVADYSDPNNVAPVTPGDVISARMLVASSVERSVALRIGFRTASGGFAAWSSIGPYVSVPADGDLVELKIEAQTVPSNAAYAYVHTTSAPGVGTWIEGTRAMLEVSPTVSTYFDGDTPSGATDNEPHYRWTGTPHASASEKYLPAIPDSGSDAWNITEQWQYTSAGWKPVEVSHEVIATVDLGKATVGELDGIRIMGQTIRGEQLSGDAIDGKVITGGTYRTSGGNGSWSDAGLFIAQPDGTSMVRFPTDGSPLSLTASDTQIERASIGDLDLSNGAVRSGGEFTLASGVTAPASPPELTTGWQKFTTLEPHTDAGHDAIGLAYWGEGDGHWIRGINVHGASMDQYDCVEIYDYATGEFQSTFPVGLNPDQGMTVIGNILYIMGNDHFTPGVPNRFFIDGYDLTTGARVSRHEYTRGIQAQNALGNDGTNLIIASVYNKELWVHRRNPVTGVQVGSDMRSGSNSWPASGGKDLFGVRISGNDVEVVAARGGRVYLNSNNALVRKTDSANASGYAGWALPARDVAGMVMRSGSLGVNVPFVVDGAGDVCEGTQFSSDTNVSACFTWYDGTNETTPSPVLVGSFPARSNPRFSMPARAGMQKRLYFNFGSWNYVTLPEDMTTFSWMNVLDYGLTTGAPPTTNTFPNADPATLKSTNDTFEVKGDGSGHWGPLTFNADGTMTSSQIPEWVPVTTFLNGAGVQTFGFAPAYRVWPDGKVEWRGVVKFPATTGTLEILTVPTVARPAVDVHASAAASAPSTGMARLDVCDPASPTTIRVSMSASKEWVSLDSLYYYLT